MADGVGGVIDDILNAIGAGAAVVAKKAFNAIKSVWNTSTDFWWRLAQGHFSLTDAINKLREVAQWFSSRAGIAIWWIIHTYVPKWVQNAVSDVVSWISRIINDIRSLISRVEQDIVRWATSLINRIVDTVTGLIRWAQAQIGQLWHDLTAVIHTVTHFLTNPAVLVAWLWDTAILYAREWVRSHEEAFARWFLATAVRGTQRLAAIIEELIIRIL